MDDPADVKLAGLSRFVFSAPSWRRSLLIAVVLGLAVDLGLWLYPVGGPGRFFGTLAFTLPTVAGFLLTKPMVEALDRPLTWNRSALLAAASMIFMVLITMPAALLARELLPLVYACAIGFALGLRLLVLVAVSDYRVLYMVGPAATQPVGLKGTEMPTSGFSSARAPADRPSTSARARTKVRSFFIIVPPYCLFRLRGK
jgi:putative membrane protein